MQEFLRLVGCGYTLILILISCIIGIWHNEWQEVEALESDNRQIDEFRKDINNIHIQLIEFSLLGETILEWDDEDLGLYHARRMSIDSMFCRFKATYPAERIDSVRLLLKDKERQICQIVQILEQQQAINDKITSQVPVIVQKVSWASSAKRKKRNQL